MKDLTWASGARHTIKGKLVLKGFELISDPSDPLVFHLWADKGYVYEKGRGMIIKPTGERIYLRSQEQPSK
jgi:hypothetical protein